MVAMKVFLMDALSCVSVVVTMVVLKAAFSFAKTVVLKAVLLAANKTIQLMSIS